MDEAIAAAGTPAEPIADPMHAAAGGVVGGGAGEGPPMLSDSPEAKCLTLLIQLPGRYDVLCTELNELFTARATLGQPRPLPPPPRAPASNPSQLDACGPNDDESANSRQVLGRSRMSQHCAW